MEAKQLKLTFLLAVLMGMVGANAFAHDIGVKNADGVTIYYTYMNNKTELAVSYRGSYSSDYSDEYSGVVNIPESVTYNGMIYPVTSIGEYAFYYCSGLTSVTIPNSVTSIGTFAFYGCSGLTSVTIPNSVTSIGSAAFSSSVNVDENNTAYSSIDGVLFNKSQTELIRYPGGKQYTIPNSVTSIGSRAFFGCHGLTSVTIPNSVTSIGERAFEYCSGLTKVIVNDIAAWCNISFTDWNSNPLYYAKHLYSDENTEITNLVIPDGVTTIKDYAFDGCTGLTSVTIGNSVTSIGSYAFDGCTGLTSVTIGNSVTSIGFRAFADCTGLTSVTIPNSVTSIGLEPFYRCTGLTSVTINSNAIMSEKYYNTYNSLKGIFGEQVKSYTIGDGVTSIGGYAFYKCSGLTSVTIPNSVTSIGDRAFEYCSGLTKVIVNDIAAWCNISFTDWNSNPLTYAKHLYSDENTEITNLVIPDGVTTIKSYAFEDCSGLTSVTIGNSVTSIGKSAFSGCSGLTSVTIPSSVTHIDMSVTDVGVGLFFVTGAFAYCSSLIEINVDENNTAYSSIDGVLFNKSQTELILYPRGKQGAYVIPNSVTSIGNDAFRGCSGLASVTIPNSVTSIGDRAFVECSGLTSVTIGNSVTSIGDWAFYYCTGLTSVTIPNSVTSIGGAAFYGCTGLTSVTIGNSVTSIGAGAFSGCTGLTSVTIPNSVTSIEEYAFEDCDKLTDIYCYIVEPLTIEWSVFYGVPTNTCMLHVPVGSKVKYEAANYWKNFLNIVEDLMKERIAQTITWNNSQTTLLVNNEIELTAVASSGLPITYTIKSGNDYATLVTSGEKTFLRGVKAGTVIVEAKQVGNDEYQPINVEKVFTISELRTAQTITWSQSQAYVVGLNSDIELTAVASSGLPITYTIKSGSDCATLITSGDKTSLKGIKPGTVIVEAKQVGNSEYQPASVEKEFTISELRTAQTITWSQIQAYVVGLNSDIELTAVASSGLPITYVIKSGSDCATLITSGDKTSLRGIKIGTVVIEAKQDGNSEYQPASVEKEFTINKKTSQRITWSQEIEAVVGDSLILSATSSSGLPVAYRALDEDYCSKMEIKQNAKGQYVVHFSNRAPSIIEAYQEGNDTYNAAEPVRKYYNSLNPTETDGLMCINGIYYKYTDNTHTALKMVRGFKQYEGDIVFPAVVNGLPVTKMDSDATYICPLVTTIEFKEGHSHIEGVHYDMALEKLILPSTTSYIGYLVFFCCPKLKDIYLYAATPPEVASSYDYNQWNEGEGKTLYVPRGTKSAYENADFWKHFTIVEIDVPTGIISIDNSQSAIDNDVWFTLSGVRLNGKPTKAGIYIVNGKKVVIK